MRFIGDLQTTIATSEHLPTAKLRISEAWEPASEIRCGKLAVRVSNRERFKQLSPRSPSALATRAERSESDRDAYSASSRSASDRCCVCRNRCKGERKLLSKQLGRLVLSKTDN